jgi:hypothetical protein
MALMVSQFLRSALRCWSPFLNVYLAEQEPTVRPNLMQTPSLKSKGGRNRMLKAADIF